MTAPNMRFRVPAGRNLRGPARSAEPVVSDRHLIFQLAIALPNGAAVTIGELLPTGESDD